ncbi:MAG: hypothetical protein C0609_06915, partial [Deltaproteobacteria bacterium]
MNTSGNEKMRRHSASLAAAIIAVVISMFATDAMATHYPDGAFCYDCHAVSRSQMVSGTKLIRSSARTIALLKQPEWDGTSMPCLFCHSEAASSVASSTEMVSVDDIFDSPAMSKHRVSISSSFTTNADFFSCVDCHDNAAYVSTGGDTIHGEDASTAEITWADTINTTNFPGLIISDPYSICNDVDCHNPDGVTQNPYGAV